MARQFAITAIGRGAAPSPGGQGVLVAYGA